MLGQTLAQPFSTVAKYLGKRRKKDIPSCVQKSHPLVTCLPYFWAYVWAGRTWGWRGRHKGKADRRQRDRA